MPATWPKTASRNQPSRSRPTRFWSTRRRNHSRRSPQISTARGLRTMTSRSSNRGRTESALPANVDAERAILGAILLNNVAIQQTNELMPDDFVLDSHRRIFRRMRDLTVIDSVTLGEELERHGELETVGGYAYIATLF